MKCRHLLKIVRRKKHSYKVNTTEKITTDLDVYMRCMVTMTIRDSNNAD